jgi:hypothetical protein
MGHDQNQEAHVWPPRSLGITILQTFITAPVLKSSIWRASQAVGSHFLEQNIVYRLAAGLPPSHSGWQFFMSGPGDITHPHIDPPLTRSLFWQVIGSKIWCTWPATKENLGVFEQTEDGKRSWQWAMENLNKTGRKLFMMEPGTWWVLDVCEIHACISLSPSVHASQEFFHAKDAEKILTIWRYTEYTRNNSNQKRFVAEVLPEEHAKWLPDPFDKAEHLESVVANAIALYDYARQMVEIGKSDEVTLASELDSMLPLVRDWIEKEATRVRQQ